MVTLKVESITDLDDGTAEVKFIISDDDKRELMKLLGMKHRWSQKKFQSFVLEALKKNLKDLSHAD